MTSFEHRLRQLKSDLVTQGDRVYQQLLRAVESYFDRDAAKAAEVVAGDEVIDRVDVEIERASIPLLAIGEADEHAIRFVLTIVKVNNELERCADCAVDIAGVVREYHREMTELVPPRFRVMANSVIGMLRDSNRALADLNVDLAQQVLAFDDTVSQFKREIELDAEEQVANGGMPVRLAFRLRTVTARLERVADHCTNICEQVIYLESGKIVRHLPGGWTKPELPSL
ncbi:MAG: phosphate signaling complex protein PhoU [Phycisphaerales bacterium]|nr:phosphate signaling complex protein PhoU [Phycisphaerae bacterium]NNF42888.1 phosphate signaling complex protein PhoU [Phycisphaerales bacterium]NNM26565.1 phosphate signaling complex protein PhoU [Phycisphaerales bacterium]